MTEKTFTIPPPPEGYESWTACYESNGIPEELWPIHVAINIMAERRAKEPPVPPRSPTNPAELAAFQDYEKLEFEKKKHRREIEPGTHEAPQDLQADQEVAEIERRRKLYAIVKKPPGYQAWVGEFEDLYNDGFPCFFLRHLVTENNCSIWRFEGRCPVCKEIHDVTPNDHGRCWSVAWDHKSLNAVVTCLKDGKRRFVRALEKMGK